MPDGEAGLVAVGPVAGIAIVHELCDGITLAPPPRGSAWEAAAPVDGAVRIRHVVGRANVDGADPVFVVGPHAAYHDLGRDRIGVLMTDLVPGVDSLLLATVREGEDYEMRYATAPADPVPRNISEIPAYALALASRGAGVLAHGCGFVMRSGRGAICLGVSGAGKSTLARMMQTMQGVRVLNDDRIVLADRGSGIRAWSTPWPGRAGIARPGDAPLGAIAIIGRGREPSARRLSGREATTALLQTLAVPAWAPAQAGAVLELIDAVYATVPVVRLEYPLAERTAEWIHTTLEALAT